MGDVFFSDSHSTLYHGDSRVILASLPADSIDCTITSPPYWSLRSYAGIEPLVFGGRTDCEHEFDTVQGTHNGAQAPVDSSVCRLCSAWRGHYGLEPTPQMYIDHSMEYLDALWRVLKKSGTVFWNLGDSYIGGKGQSGYELPHEAKERHGRGETLQRGEEVPGYMPMRPSDGKIKGLKPKDMALIPFRFAIAAQERGWWVRSVIIWAKTNPMPESVKDRPTDSHEYIFLLTKSARYYCNMDAVREPLASGLSPRTMYNGENAVDTKSRGYNTHAGAPNPMGRNARSVWTVPTHGYPEAHFATFPEELPKRCIQAGCPDNGTVLDPFAGAGTTLYVARQLGRKSIGVELSMQYCDLIVDRIRQLVLL